MICAILNGVTKTNLVVYIIENENYNSIRNIYTFNISLNILSSY